MIQYSEDEHFRQFAQSLEMAIDKYDLTKDQLLRQEQQVDTLVALEKEFRQTLIKHPWGPGVYRDFVKMICDEKRNILAARPYFRERQADFTSQISKALKNRSEKALYRFRFNYQFVLFAVKARKWRQGSKIAQLAKKISDVRTEIIEMNMPLAISRARIFYSRTPKSQLTMMDFVQIACEGLMSAVDKFVPPFSKVFRSVAIGRMVGNFIEQYSETLIHFYPTDKRKLYRANKLIGRFAGGVDYDTLAEEINKGVEDVHRTNASEIADLMAAASCVSTDTPAPGDPEAGDAVARFSAPEASRPDVIVEKASVMNALGEAIANDLTVFQQKLLKLKGVGF